MTMRPRTVRTISGCGNPLNFPLAVLTLRLCGSHLTVAVTRARLRRERPELADLPREVPRYVAPHFGRCRIPQLGNCESALSSCEAKPTGPFSSACLAVVYEELNLHQIYELRVAEREIGDDVKKLPRLRSQAA